MPPDSRAPSRQYPHVDGITDWRAQQSLRLLWDRVADLGLRLEASEAHVTELGTTLDATVERLTLIQQAAGEALALAQRTADESSGGGPSGGPATGPGSLGDPIVPMSDDAATAEDQIKRSLAYYGRTDYSYWGPYIHIPGMAPWQAGDGKWYVGHSAYVEQRMVPGDNPSAPHALLPLPATHQDPVPPGYPLGGWT